MLVDTRQVRSQLWQLVWAVILLLLTSYPSAAASVAPSPKERPQPVYHPVTLSDGEILSPTTLDALTEYVRRSTPEAGRQIVLLVHGYNTSQQSGRKQYLEIATDLRREAGKVGLHVAVIGIHWSSYPGPLHHWLPGVLGYRFLSELGFRNAVRNPYLRKVSEAVRLGRSGVRQVALHLRDEFPNTPLHVLAHSLGSEIAIRALAPETLPEDKKGVQTFAPDRVLQLDLVVLAGADVDQDAFTPDHRQSALTALDRARLWWITMPKDKTADAVLELRRSAGRRDAIGNVGLLLARPDFDRLMQRHALVLDDRDVSLRHDILSYYTSARLRSLVQAMLYLQSPENPRAADSIPAQIAHWMETGATATHTEKTLPATQQLYEAWISDTRRPRYRGVRIQTPERSSRAADSGRVAGRSGRALHRTTVLGYTVA